MPAVLPHKIFWVQGDTVLVWSTYKTGVIVDAVLRF